MPEPENNKSIEPLLVPELIDLIYSVVLDAKQWPMLTQALSETFDSVTPENLSGENTNITSFLDRCYDDTRTTCDDTASSIADEKQLKLGEVLRPHLERATALARQLEHGRETSRALEAVIDRLPIGILMCNEECQIMRKNRRARVILESRLGLSVQNGKVVADSATDTSRLHTLIRQACENDADLNESNRACSITPPCTGASLSLIVAASPSSSSGTPQATLFITAPDMPCDIPMSRLQGLYGLTRAESRLVNALANGKDIETICTEHQITRNTVRTHLKSIFTKTRTSRQSELVRLVLLGPAMAVSSAIEKDGDDTGRKPQVRRGRKQAAVRDCHIPLADGRTLGYREYGDREGFPVIHMHTMPASRRQMHPDTGLPARLGIRLLAPDRPGIGLSSPMPGRSVTDWCDDIKQLARHTGVKQFGVIGYGSGTPYALAVAASFPDKVKHVALASAVFHDYSLRDLRGISSMQRMLYATARCMPALLVQIIRHSARAVHNNPDRYIDILTSNQTGPDKEILANPRVMKNLRLGYLDALQEEGRYIAEESLLQSRHWGFDFSAIQAYVRIWHGEQNYQNPIDFSHRLTNSLPHCELTPLSDAGHFLIYTQHWMEVLIHAAGSGRYPS